MLVAQLSMRTNNSEFRMRSRNQHTARHFIVEFLVIALGVFAGLAADNWNDGRKDRELERAFVAGIAIDLRTNIEEITRQSEAASQMEASVLRVITAVRTGESQWSTPEEMVGDLVRCTYLGTPRLSSIAWDELRSTGSLRILRDSKFKRRLANYYQRFEYHSQFHPEYRRKEAAVEEALLGLLPLEARNQMSEADLVTQAGVTIQDMLQRLQQAPLLVQRLEDVAWVQHRIAGRYGWVTSESKEMLAEIEAADRRQN
jgi:hypothetical protein